MPGERFWALAFFTRLFPVLRFVHYDLCILWSFLIFWYLFLKVFLTKLLFVLSLYTCVNIWILWPLYYVTLFTFKNPQIMFVWSRFESVIHEFDPYFNYRTTKYLAEKGFYSFHNWFDDRAWWVPGVALNNAQAWDCSISVLML